MFAVTAGLGEVAGGLLIATGLLGPIGPSLIITVMVVAIVAVHLPNGFFAQANGYELPLVYAVSGFLLAILGPGMYSLDALLSHSGVWNASVAWFMAGGAVVVGLVNAALRRPAARPVATAQRRFEAYETAEVDERGLGMNRRSNPILEGGAAV